MPLGRSQEPIAWPRVGGHVLEGGRLRARAIAFVKHERGRADALRVRAHARHNAVWVAPATLASMAMAWLGLYGFGWNDYEVEALPAVNALVHGHLGRFFAVAPMYGGSLLERAPFALLPGLWGGGQLAVYRLMAAPCLLAAAALGVWLAARIRTQGTRPLAAWLALGLCVANPLTLGALELGHPDELLGAVLCVGGVLLAARGRPAWAGVALGLAFVNKEWAALAIGPVLLALPARRALCAGVAGAVAVTLLAPFAALGTSAFASGLGGAAQPGSAIFQPWQWWWFLGHHGAAVKGLFGDIKVGYRTAPGWIGTVSHPLIVALALPLTAGAWRTLRRRERFAGETAGKHRPGGAHPSDAARQRIVRAGRRESTALLLLALLLLARCALDTWDVIYYPLPFVLALTAWESLALGRAPMLALGSTVAVWADARWLPSFASADAQAAFFAAWSVPLAVGLAGRLLLGRPLWRPLLGGSRARPLPGPLLDRLQLLRQPRERLVPLGGHDNQVLDAHAEAS